MLTSEMAAFAFRRESLNEFIRRARIPLTRKFPTLMSAVSLLDKGIKTVSGNEPDPPKAVSARLDDATFDPTVGDKHVEGAAADATSANRVANPEPYRAVFVSLF